MKDESKEAEMDTTNCLDIQANNLEQLRHKLNAINTKDISKISIRGDGSCLYRAILVSLNQNVNKYLELRNELSNLI